MHPVSYLILRLAVAASMFGHGIVRLPKIKAFSDGTVLQFQESGLPEIIVRSFGYFIPIAELVIGILLIAGLMTRVAAIAGGVLMILLIAGTSAIENWGAIPSQLIHTAFFAVLVQFVYSNTWAVDKLLRK